MSDFAEPPPPLSQRLLQDGRQVIAGLALEFGFAIDFHCRSDVRQELRADLANLETKALAAAVAWPETRGAPDGSG